MTHVYELAKQYTDCHYSVFPVLPHDKRPHFDLLKAAGWVGVDGRGTWEPAIKAIAGNDLITTWFAKNGVNIAIVGGPVSDNRVFLDFDDPQSYRAWGLAHKAIVNRTPVQKTAKGYHVVIQTEDNATGPIYFNGKKVGEVRGVGGYAVAPPSIHQTGAQYRWLICPFDVEPIYVDSLATINLSRSLPQRQQRSYVPYIPRGSDRRAADALKRLAAWRKDDYQAWLSVGIALSELGEAGRQLWHEWSAGNSKYDAKALDDHFDSFKRQAGPIMTLGSLFFWAQTDDPGGKQARTSGWRSM